MAQKWRCFREFLGVKKGVAEGLRLLFVFKKARELLAQKLRRINKERAFQQSRKSKKNVSGLSQQGVACCVVDERRADRWLRKSF